VFDPSFVHLCFLPLGRTSNSACYRSHRRLVSHAVNAINFHRTLYRLLMSNLPHPQGVSPQSVPPAVG